MLLSIVNTIIKKVKGPDYILDQSIPSSYLLLLLFTRGMMLIRGKMAFIKHKGTFFIGSNVSISARSLIKLGKNVTIDDGCLINAISKEGVVLGNNTSLGKNTVIECTGSLMHLGKGIVVGDNVGLGRDSFYGSAGGIKIGNDTIIGNYVSFHSENHNIEDINLPIRVQGVNHKGIVVGEGCWIGAKATILDGANIGNGCVIAAGSVVTAGIYKDNGIYGGVPAKLLKQRT